MKPIELILTDFVIPVWLVAGFSDWICHRATSIEKTAGFKESAVHMLMFFEVGSILLPILFLEINAAVIGIAIVAFILHEATALYDVSYAITARFVSPVEQFIHSFLEVIPLMAIISIVVLNWSQFLALFGQGDESARFALAWKHQPLPSGYVSMVMGIIVVFEFLPYAEELFRCYRAGGWK